jgi:hypothetical protein
LKRPEFEYAHSPSAARKSRDEWLSVVVLARLVATPLAGMFVMNYQIYETNSVARIYLLSEG